MFTFKDLLQTKKSWSQTVVRLTLGGVLFPHGAQKMLGWFGGPGFIGEMNHLTGAIGLPWLVGFLVIIIEFFGSLLLLTGTLTRISALSIFGLFTGIIFTVHLQYGFFMNWFGNKAGEGFEYHLLVLGLALTLIIAGGGKYAIDNYLLDKYSSEEENYSYT